MDFKYDRRVPDDFLEAFTTGCLAPLTLRVHSDRSIWDMCARREAGSSFDRGRCWMTIYAGLSGVLNIHRKQNGWSLSIHKSYQALPEWNPAWSIPQSIEQLCADIEGLLAFLDAAAARVRQNRSFFEGEGRVHASFAAGDRSGNESWCPDLRLVDREANVGFASEAHRTGWIAARNSRFAAALQQVNISASWWPPPLPKGAGCDFLCTDGQVLYAVEAKPASASKGITAGPLQVQMYAELFAAWVGCDANHQAIVDRMVEQRQRLGLGRAGTPLVANPQVVPVLLIGAGTPSPNALARARLVANTIASYRSAGVDAMQWWRVDSDGYLSCA